MIRKVLKKNKKLRVFIYSVINFFYTRTKESGTNNKLITKGSLLKNVKIIIKGKNNYIELLDDARIYNTMFYINGDNNKILIQKGVRYNKGSLWFEDSYGTILISENTSIESAHLAVTGIGKKIEIGKDCMFSSDIEIRTGDSHSIINNITGQRINIEKDVIIGNHVWIGSNVSVLKGSIIGNNSIVGTRSLVSGEFTESNVILAGVPARIVKSQINWNRERIF